MNAPAAQAALDASASAAVTIGRPAEELRTLWLQPDTQSRIWAHFANVTASGDGAADWVAHGPAGGEYRWQAQTDASAADALSWTSLDGADVANTGSLRFRPAPGDRGTELHLDIRFDPPGGIVGEAAVKLFRIVPREIVLTALYRFRALVLTGEIPTTDHQPAARNGGTDR